MSYSCLVPYVLSLENANRGYDTASRDSDMDNTIYSCDNELSEHGDIPDGQTDGFKLHMQRICFHE